MLLSRKPLPALLIAASCMAVISGCDRRTPDERLATAVQFYQQGDEASAEMEALKVVDKAGDDPAAVNASVLLANIYARQNRVEEAEEQLASALNHVSQLDPIGKEVLRMYLGSLTNQKKYDEALKTIEKYQKEYAEDPGTSLSLTVARADINTISGETTTARTILQDVIAATTAPAELALYRDLYTKTYLRDRDTTAAVGYLKQQLDKVEGREDRQTLLVGLASLEASADNYEESRGYLEQVTSATMQDVREEPDAIGKAAIAMQLGQIYVNSGNLPGARETFNSIYNSGIDNPQAMQAVVNGMMESMLRLGETSATESLLKDADKKYPQVGFGEVLKRMQDAVAKGELGRLAPQDTSTLVLKYKNDPQTLWPAELAGELKHAVETSGTLTAGANTTGTIEAAVETSAPVAAATDDAATSPGAVPAPPAAGDAVSSESAAM